MSYKIVVIFQNGLYACSNIQDDECYSWDIDTGEKKIHEPVIDELARLGCFSIVEVNGKIWVNGGVNRYSYYYEKQTFFLSSNFEWSKGIYLPKNKAWHTSVAIDNIRVVLFGGETDHVWIYNDESETFEIKKPYNISRYLSACKVTNFYELGNDVILVRGSEGQMTIYDWKIDLWFKLDPSWTFPTLFYFNIALFQENGR